MPLSPLRPPAAPVQDAPRKISTPLPAADHSKANAFGASRSGSVTRPSNPALQAATGASGFDAGAPRTGGPRISLPATGAPQPTKGTGQTTGTSAVGTVSGTAIDRIFNLGSKSFEKILGSLGQSFPPVSDPTARLQQRSDQLGSLLKGDPSLVNQVSRHDKMQAMRISRIFSNPTFYNSLNDLQKAAVDSYQGTMSMLCAEWPPPPSGGRSNG